MLLPVEESGQFRCHKSLRGKAANRHSLEVDKEIVSFVSQIWYQEAKV